MEYEKFDVERALAGEAVILRNGSKAYVRYKEEEFEMGLPLIGVDLGRERWTTWRFNGSLYANGRDYDYDIVGMWPKEPLTVPDSFWDMLHPHYNVIAKDGSGSWYAYNKKPNKLDTVWDYGGVDFINLAAVICCSFFPDCDWEDSLILRPNK